jgi:hypothetical protein
MDGRREACVIQTNVFETANPSLHDRQADCGVIHRADNLSCLQIHVRIFRLDRFIVPCQEVPVLNVIIHIPNVGERILPNRDNRGLKRLAKGTGQRCARHDGSKWLGVKLQIVQHALLQRCPSKHILHRRTQSRLRLGMNVIFQDRLLIVKELCIHVRLHEERVG